MVADKEGLSVMDSFSNIKLVRSFYYYIVLRQGHSWDPAATTSDDNVPE